LSGRKSITVRLTLLFALVSTIVLLLLGMIVGPLVERHFEELDMDLLTGKLEQVQYALRKVNSREELQALSRQLDDSLIGHHGMAVNVLAPDGRLLFSSGDAEFPTSLLAARSQEPTGPTLWTNSAHRDFRGIAAEAPTSIKDLPPAVVAVATDIAHHVHFMRSFRMALWSVVAVAAVLSGFLGWIAVRRGLAPLKEIRQRAADITANRLDQRLSVTAIPAELAEVAETLNEMLARLQESFRRLSDFSSDLAHELRTPVTNLLTQTQVILSKARTPEEYRDVLASNAEELERLSRMIADMLFLAKSDNALIVPRPESIDLSHEVKGLIEFYELVAEDKNVALTCSGHGSVSGDRLMLRRAISNLLSNAVRHTPAGGRVDVRIDDTEESVVKLCVDNSGETIAAEHLPRLFGRFYRVNSARQRGGEGAGLGLAITRSILRAHGGDVSARSENGLTTFELRIPSARRTGLLARHGANVGPADVAPPKV
jgi:two-component system heavy metal sensor histidine kinase CusS